MKRFYYAFTFMLLAGSLLNAPAALAQCVNQVVTLLNSAGAPLAGGVLYRNTHTLVGTTNASGEVTACLPAIYSNLRMKYNNTEEVQTLAELVTSGFTFRTREATVRLENHEGIPLNGADVRLSRSGNYIGTTGDSALGEVKSQVFGDTLTFWILFSGGVDEKTQNINSPVVFKTGQLILQFSGSIRHGGPHGPVYTAPLQLLPVPHTFYFYGTGYPSRKSLSLTPTAGASTPFSVFYVRLQDSAGNGVAGGQANLGVGGWPSMGTTDTDGTLVYARSGLVGNMQVRMTAPGCGGTETSPSQAHATNSFYNFQTTKAVVQLKDHAGALLDGGTVQAGCGGWPVIGTTGDDGTGTVHHEMFAGSYNFRMVYNYGTELKNHDIATPLIFQTGLVKLHFSGTIAHGVGGWPAYSNPFEMLPVEHRFGFSGTGHPRTEMNFTPTAGQVLEQTVGYVRVKKSNDSGQDGVEAAWHKFAKLPRTNVPGATNANGALLFAMDGHNTSQTLVRVEYEGGRLEKGQVPTTNSFYVFQMSKVTVELHNACGVPIAGASPNVRINPYANLGSQTNDLLVNGLFSKDLIPDDYEFRINDYNGTSQQLPKVTIAEGSAATVVFQTGQVADGGFGATKYWQFARPKQNFANGIELFPGNHFFQNGTTKQLSVVAGQVLNLSTEAYSAPTCAPSKNMAGAEVEVPRVFDLREAYPNPFNPSTTLGFTLEESGYASLRVYNVMGQEVATLFDGPAEAGRLYQARFDAGQLASGIYLYRLTSGGKVQINRMLLVK